MSQSEGTESKRKEMHQRIQAFLRFGENFRGESFGGEENFGEGFEALALDLVHYQKEALPSYGRLFPKEALGDWREAPLVPTDLFRELDLSSAPKGKDDVVFKTSGTTQGKRGFRRMADLSLYNMGMTRPFLEGVLEGEKEPIRWVSLIPHFRVQSDSSLSYMVTELSEPLAKESFWLIDKAGLDFALAEQAFNEGLGDGSGAVLVLTTGFALVELMKGMKRFQALPKGSRFMVTGGFKGKRRPIAAKKLYRKIKELWGVPEDMVFSEYGMCELSSQAYAKGLIDGEPHFRPMKTLRFRIIDPKSGKEVPKGEEGLVACFDLLNLDHVSHILTGDWGYIDEEGLLVLKGRYEGEVERGCHLTAEELLG